MQEIVKLETCRARRSPLLVASLLGSFAFAACDASSNAVAVATAADRSFAVEEAVEMLVPRTDLPIDSSVITVVGELWIDYTLFAHAFGDDPTLSHLDFDPIVEPQLEQEMILELRDLAIDADTAIGDEELREIFGREGPGVTARARHVLLTPPDRATDAQRDSVRAQAASLRERIVDGEDFAEIALQFSDDRASGRQGGNLGTFERGQFVRSLEEAIFALDVGEVSEVVETPYGYHVVELQELNVPPFESVAEGFRLQVQNRRFQVAESAFIAGLQDAAEPRPQSGAADLLREIARDPRFPLAGRTGSRVVARYQGGEIALEEVRQFFLTRTPQYLEQVTGAPDDVLEEQVIATLVQRELLVADALARGLEPTAERRDSLTEMARAQFVATGRQLGLVEVDRGPRQPDGATRAVRAIVGGIVGGTREIVPLGPIAYVLREQYRHGVSPVGVTAALTRIDEIRGPGFVPSAPPEGAQAADSMIADSTAEAGPPPG